MANKPLCASCEKERGVFECHGCKKSFCWQHTTDHRQTIIDQLDDVCIIQNNVQQLLTDQAAKPQHEVQELRDNLVKKIDQWEQASVKKIRGVAEETRKQLLEYTTERWTYLQTKLDLINKEMQGGYQSHDFVETDLYEWTNQLNQLREEITSSLNLRLEDDYITLINKIRISNLNETDIFERSSGNADFQEDKKVVCVKNGPDIYTEVRGKREYTTGCHTVRFKVEQITGWTLFGIITKSSPLQIHSYNSPSCYGWYNGEGFIYAAGQCQHGHGHDLIQNDIAHLLVDCDNRRIRLRNERTNQTLELNVDINKCPFPWQLHLNLNMVPTCIRLL